MNGKTRFRRLAWRAANALLIAFGVFALYTFFVGVANDEIALFSKSINASIRHEQSPIGFWLVAMAWLLGGLYVIGLGIDGWRKP